MGVGGLQQWWHADATYARSLFCWLLSDCVQKDCVYKGVSIFSLFLTALKKACSVVYMVPLCCSVDQYALTSWQLVFPVPFAMLCGQGDLKPLTYDVGGGLYWGCLTHTLTPHSPESCALQICYGLDALNKTAPAFTQLKPDSHHHMLPCSWLHTSCPRYGCKSRSCGSSLLQPPPAGMMASPTCFVSCATRRYSWGVMMN